MGVDRARRTRCVRSSIRAAVAHAAGGVNTRFEKGIVRLHPKGHSGALSLSLEEQFLYPLLFRAGWWLFFAGSVFLGWNSLGILVLLLHTLLDRRALTGLWRSAQQAVGPVVLSLGRWRMPLNYILVGLGLTGLASSALAVEPARAAAATAGMLLSIVFGLVYALLLEQVQPGWYRAYLWPAVVAGAGHIAWVFWEASQLESLWYRVETIGGPNGTGTLMLLAVVLALPWFAACRDGRRWLGIPYTVAAVAAMLLTQSRGTWLAVAAFGICLLMPLWRDPVSRRYAVVAVLCAALVLALGFAFIPGATDRLQRFLDLSDEGRVSVYEIAWDMFLDNFWFGVGPANFGNHWEEYNRGRSAEDVGFPHNTWLQVLTETGVVGGALFAALVFYVLLGVWRLRDTDDWVVWILASGIVAILVRDQVDTAIFSINVGFVFWWLAGTVLAFQQRAGRGRAGA